MPPNGTTVSPYIRLLLSADTLGCLVVTIVIDNGELPCYGLWRTLSL